MTTLQLASVKISLDDDICPAKGTDVHPPKKKRPLTSYSSKKRITDSIPSVNIGLAKFGIIGQRMDGDKIDGTLINMRETWNKELSNKGFGEAKVKSLVKRKPKIRSNADSRPTSEAEQLNVLLNKSPGCPAIKPARSMKEERWYIQEMKRSEKEAKHQEMFLLGQLKRIAVHGNI